MRKKEANSYRHLKRVREGQQIAITDRGEAVAGLSPLSESQKTLMALRQSPKIRWNGGKPAGLQGAQVREEAIAVTVLRERR